MENRGTSAHYVIKGDGTITQFVPDADMAYHVGMGNNGELQYYLQDNTDWKELRVYEGVIILRETLNGLRAIRWEDVHPELDKPVNFTKDTQFPNLYSIGIELVGPEIDNRPFFENKDRKYPYRRGLGQIRGLVLLLRNLVKKYNIPISREYIVGHEDVNPITRFQWDPGPDFDWDDVLSMVEGRSKCIFPLDIGAGDAPSLRWYANTELKGKGGYFPVGSNAMIHTGVHLFGDNGTVKVRSMAAGYVVAFRFLPEKPREQLANGTVSFSENTSFILLRHDLYRQATVAGGAVAGTQPVYSLYMDLEASPGEIREIPWAKKLLEQLGRDGGLIPPAKASFNRDTFESDKVITFSKPLLSVKAGETLWYTKGDGGNNHIHWEVFTPEENLFRDMLVKGTVGANKIEFEGAHGILSPDEINRLFSHNGFRRLLISVISFNDGVKEVFFPDFLNWHFSKSESEYTGRLKSNRPGNPGRRSALVEAQLRGSSSDEVFRINLRGNKITILQEIGRGLSVCLDLAALFSGRCSVTLTLHIIEKIYGLAVSMERPPDWDGDLEIGIDHESFFKEFAGDPKMLRNAWFSSVSMWTKNYCNTLMEKLNGDMPENRRHGLTIEAFADSILFDPDTECPVYDPIFSGEGAFINPDSPMEYMHPVTFMWLYMLDNEMEFEPPLNF